MQTKSDQSTGREAPGRHLGQLVKNSGISYGSTVTMLMIGLAIKASQARILSRQDLGLLLTAQTIAALAATAGQLSLPEAVVNFVGRAGRTEPHYTSALVRAAITITLGCGALLVFFVWLFGPYLSRIYQNPSLGRLLLFLFFAIPFNSATLVLCSAYRGFGQMWQKVLYVDTIPAAITLGGLLLVGRAGLTEPAAVALVYLVASVSSAALVLLFVLKEGMFIMPCGRVDLRPVLSFSLPLLCSEIAVAWPTAMIPLFLGAGSLSSVAYYKIALALGALSYTVVGAAEVAALPIWSSMIAQGGTAGIRADYTTATTWCLIGSSVFFVPLFCRAEDVIELVYGPRYSQGAIVLRWIAPFFLLSAATGPNESLLKAFGDTKWILITRFSVSLSAATAFSLGPSQDLIGAVTSYWISAVIGQILYVGYLMFVRGIHPFSPLYFRSAAAVALSVGATFAASPWIGFRWHALNLISSVLLYISFLALGLWQTGYLSSGAGRRVRELLVFSR